MEVTDYQIIRERIKVSGKEAKIRSRAKELQTQLSEPPHIVPFKDAYGRAYNEMVDNNNFSF